MNKSIIEAQQIIYSAITFTVSKAAQNKLARAAFYLGDQVWESSSPIAPRKAA